MEGKEICFSADYIVVTRVRHKSCYPVMEKARQAGFLASLIYSATIKIFKGHEHNFFEDPVKLENFLRQGVAKKVIVQWDSIQLEMRRIRWLLTKVLIKWHDNSSNYCPFFSLTFYF